MTEWFESMAGPAYAPALMWTALALLALLLVLVAVKLFRSLTAGTFIAGGRNRRARLAVLDATAIDNQRRLVLVRRDDVEHLILIGGASDLVVERDIHAYEEAAEAAPDALIGREVTALAAEHAAPEPRPAAEARPVAQPAPQAPASRPSNIPSSQPAAAPVPDVTASRPAPAPVPEPRLAQTSGDHGARPAVPPPHEPLPPSPPAAVRPVVEPVRSEPSPAPRPVIAEAGSAGSATKPAPARDDADLDDALLQELELTLEEEDRRPAAASVETARRDPDLDDEMDRLLGELSGERR
jgi:hypothetical protein